MHIDAPKKDDLPALRVLWKEAFGDSDTFLDAFFRTAYSPDRCRCVWLDGQPAAMLYWFDCESGGKKMAYLYAIATKAALQGKGLCRTLMQDSHALLAQQGYCGAILVPGNEALFRFYEKAGYKSFGGIRKNTCTADGNAIPLRCVSREEYAALRRQYLPAGGVVQEGATLAFLQTQAQFYTGDGFVLAATKEENTLFVPEILGATTPMPGILQSLGAEKGVFRTPGDTPFAMYLPLSETTPPAYFGLALD